MSKKGWSVEIPLVGIPDTLEIWTFDRHRTLTWQESFQQMCPNMPNMPEFDKNAEKPLQGRGQLANVLKYANYNQIQQQIRLDQDSDDALYTLPEKSF